MVDFDISLGFFWGAGEGVMGGGAGVKKRKVMMVNQQKLSPDHPL